MLKNHRFIAYIGIVLTFVFGASLVYAQPQDGFVPLVDDLPLVNDATDISDVLNALFGLTVGAAAILAVIMIAIGGFQYMGSEAFTSKAAARERIVSAVIGLLLVLSSVLLLAVINPDIIIINPFRNAATIGDGGGATPAPQPQPNPAFCPGPAACSFPPGHACRQTAGPNCCGQGLVGLPGSTVGSSDPFIGCTPGTNASAAQNTTQPSANSLPAPAAPAPLQQGGGTANTGGGTGLNVVNTGGGTTNGALPATVTPTINCQPSNPASCCAQPYTYDAAADTCRLGSGTGSTGSTNTTGGSTAAPGPPALPSLPPSF